MALKKHINLQWKTNEDTGFSDKYENQSGRFINKDGSFNVKKEGVPFFKRVSLFHTMLHMPRWKFVLTIILIYIVVNLIYTALYLMIGENGLMGIASTTPWGRVKEVFYFSAETFTTVGYGRVNPIGDAANLLAAFEAMSGFLSFAIATGLMYGRFSKAKAHIIFSHHAVIAPYRGGKGFMFRVAPFKDDHILSSVNVRVNASMLVAENGVNSYKFFELELEREKIDSLMMQWTIVHPINENSPIYGLTKEELRAADLEIYILLHGYDEVYSNNVLKRTSYTVDEIIFNAKFVPMHRDSDDGRTTIVDLSKIDQSDIL